MSGDYYLFGQRATFPEHVEVELEVQGRHVTAELPVEVRWNPDRLAPDIRITDLSPAQDAIARAREQGPPPIILPRASELRG